MIGIIDYGLGNIRAFIEVYKFLGIQTIIAKTPSDIVKAQKLILPGVGSFDYAVMLLEESGMLPQINEAVFHDKKSILGVCVGMQLLCKTSAEGQREGLGWINAHVKEFVASKDRLVPHMGWNDVNVIKTNSILDPVDRLGRFYFLHSYYVDCHDSEDVIAIMNYGEDFTCGLQKDNIYGFQFHPEKSHGSGVKLLKNFANL